MKNICIAIVVVVLAGMYMGCRVGKPYSAPTLALPEKFRGDSVTSVQDSLYYYQISWRSLFGDSTLIALIDSALTNNYDMRTALVNIEIAGRNLKRNKLDYLPAVNGDIAGINQQWRSDDFYGNPSSKWYTEKTPSATMFQYQSSYFTSVGFSWEVDIWGKIAQQRDKLGAGFFNTMEAKNAIQTKLIADIAQGYYNLQMLDAQVEVAKKNLELNDSTLQMIKLQYVAGEITALAIQQTESQRLIAASLIPELEKDIAVQENALNILTGRMPAAIERSNKVDSVILEFKDISLGAPISLLRNRIDIRIAENQLRMANADMNISQIMRYPQLSIGGTAGVNAMLPQNWFNIPGALLGGIAGGLSAPIFSNGKLRNNYEVAKLERQKTELALQRTVMEAINEVSDAIFTLDKQKEQLVLSRARVENSQLAVRNAFLLFKSDYATYLEVITAQSNALNSELDMVRMQQRQLNAFITLYRALGGGWQ